MAEPAAGANGSTGRVWEVVGGAEKGGILVREGRELKSAEAAGRLATGALVRELETVGDRLHYEIVKGDGPNTGWVSIRLKDKELLRLASVSSATNPEVAAGPPGPGGGAFVARPAPVPASRKKLRVLCLHGTSASPGVLRRQLQALARALEPDAELAYHGGHLVCSEDDPIIGSQVRLLRPFFQDEVFTQYALPTRGLDSSDGDPARPETWRAYDGLDDALARAQEALRREAPVDAVLGFSQGSNLATILAAQAATGRGVNFHCVVHMGTSLPGWTRDLPELFGEPLPVPALVITGEKDPTAHGGEKIAALYDASVVETRSHSSDHRPMPRDVKETQELAEHVRSFLLRHCRGGPAPS